MLKKLQLRQQLSLLGPSGSIVLICTQQQWNTNDMKHGSSKEHATPSSFAVFVAHHGSSAESPSLLVSIVMLAVRCQGFCCESNRFVLQIQEP